jgi:hypothetical protein
MLFKGPGPFKNSFKIGGNVDELKAYRLIPLTPPLFFHFTLPLTKRFVLARVTTGKGRTTEKHGCRFGGLVLLEKT